MGLLHLLYCNSSCLTNDRQSEFSSKRFAIFSDNQLATTLDKMPIGINEGQASILLTAISIHRQHFSNWDEMIHLC